MHSGHESNEAPQTFTFRGRSMQEAVTRLKEVLGPDAVIQGTRRARDKHGRFVEITARPGVGALQPPVEQVQSALGQIAQGMSGLGSPQMPAAVQGGVASQPIARAIQQLGQMRGAGAYARTAQSTNPTLAAIVRAQSQPDRKAGPFAERAAWLSAQIAERERANVSSQKAVTHSNALPPELMALAQGALPEGAGMGSQSGQMTSTTHQAPMHDVERPVQYAYVDAESTQDAHSNAPLSSAQSMVGADNEIGQLKAELAELKSQLSALRGDDTENDDSVTVVESIDSVDLGDVVDHFDRRIGEVLELIESPQAHANSDNGLVDGLVRSGVSRTHALDLVSRVSRMVPEGTHHDGDVLSTLQQLIADDMMIGGAIQVNDSHRRVMAFVGPTGVGKTTTVAKVASTARLAGKRVALITVDTCRAAAIEQLAGYAEVLDAPLKVVKDPKNLPTILDELAGYDVVLVDTNGRNPLNDDDVDGLQDFFSPGWGGEVVLTLACGTREADLFASINAFDRIGIDRLCITKTDETHDIGIVYSLVRRACRPLAWTTDGKIVPDDIEVADGIRWSQRVISELNRRTSIQKAS